MIVLFWIILRILFFISAFYLLYYIILKLKENGAWQTFNKKFKNALKPYGFSMGHKKYPIELYKWVICDDDDDVCDESIHRATFPAMDIAEWMKKGLPHSANGESICGKKCHCRLIHWQSKYIKQKSSN